MMMLSQTPPTYTFMDRLFLRWVEQTDWTPNTKRVCRVLFAHQRKHSQVYLLHSTLAGWLGISVATVKRAIRFLVGLGILQVTPKFRQDGGQGSNRYKVIPHILTATTTLSTNPVSTASSAIPADTETSASSLPLTEDADPLSETHTQPIVTPPHVGAKDTNAHPDVSLALEVPLGPSAHPVSSEMDPTPLEQTALLNTPNDGSADTPRSPDQPSHSATSLGNILVSWAYNRGVLSPTMTRGEAHTALGGRVSPMPLSEAPTALAGSTPPSTLKMSLDQKINNRDPLHAIDHQTETILSNRTPPVVVCPEASLKPTDTTVPSPSPEPAPSIENSLQGEKGSGAVSPWMHNLLRVGTPETIERVISWYQACPPNHPARPQHPAAWIYTAVKQNWQTPPTWMTKNTALTIRYRIVTEAEEVLNPSEETSPTPRAEDAEWTVITAWLASETPATQEFLAQIAQTLYQRLGGAFAHQALASKGPLWQATCRERWRIQTTEQISA